MPIFEEFFIILVVVYSNIEYDNKINFVLLVYMGAKYAFPFTFVIDSTFLNCCQKIIMCVFYSMSFLLKCPIIQKTFIS